VTDLATLRDKTLSPAIFAHRVPGGVLHDIGWACWEMPPGSRSGYTNFLRQDLAYYDTFLKPALRVTTAVQNALMLGLLRDALFGTYGTLDLAELPTVYANGTSIFFQSTVVGQQRIAGVDSFYDFRPDVQAIIANKLPQTKLYLQLGAANHISTPSHEINFAIQHGMTIRPGEPNPGRTVVDTTNPAWSGLNLDRLWIDINLVSGVDIASRPFYRPIVDVAKAAVVNLDHAYIQTMVTEFGTQAVYVVMGENFPYIDRFSTGFDFAKCDSDEVVGACAVCSPIAVYSPDTTAGFRSYLTGVLGLNDETIAERWKPKKPVTITTIDTENENLCDYSPYAVSDYRAFLRYRYREIGRGEYRAAKAAGYQAQVSIMAFGTAVEQSWLYSDVGAVGDWVNEDNVYLANRRWPMMLVSNAAALSGEPPMFPLSSPPAVFGTPPGQDLIPPILRTFRIIDRNHVRWWLRDILRAGTGHIGYRKAPGFSLAYYAQNEIDIHQAFNDVRDLQQEGLEAHAAWQKIAVHCDRLEEVYGSNQKGPGPVVAKVLAHRLRDTQVPYALFGDSEVMQLGFARVQLAKSITVSLFPHDQTGTANLLNGIYPSGTRGGAVIVLPMTGGDIGPVLPETNVVTPVGIIVRAVHDDVVNPPNVWKFLVRPKMNCEMDKYAQRVADALERVVVPFIASQVEDPADPIVWRPLVITGQSEAAEAAGDIVANWVTDGICFTCFVSNMGLSSETIAIDIDPRVGTALGVTYPTVPVTLGSYDTEFVTIVPTTTGITPATAIADASARLTALSGLGYDVAAGEDLLAKATALDGLGKTTRAIACYIAAVKMIYLKITFAPALTVSARRIRLLGEPAGEVPVVGAYAQYFLLLANRESGPIYTTNASGDAVMSVGRARRLYWSNVLNKLVTLTDPAIASKVEVQVTDPATGQAAKQTVGFP
jgi:hypothetical protein